MSDSGARTGLDYLPRGRRAVIAIIVILLLLVAAIVVGNEIGSPSSDFPVLSDGVGYGTVTGWTFGDVQMFLDCAIHEPSGRTLLAGFYQVPTARMSYELELAPGLASEGLESVDAAGFHEALAHTDHFVAGVVVGPSGARLSEGVEPAPCRAPR